MRTRVAEIREMGRATQGVTLIALDDGAKLIGLQRIVENDANVDAAIADADADAGDEPPTPRRTPDERDCSLAGAARRAALAPRRSARTPTPTSPGQEGAGRRSCWSCSSPASRASRAAWSSGRPRR